MQTLRNKINRNSEKNKSLDLSDDKIDWENEEARLYGYDMVVGYTSGGFQICISFDDELDEFKSDEFVDEPSEFKSNEFDDESYQQSNEQEDFSDTMPF